MTFQMNTFVTAIQGFPEHVWHKYSIPKQPLNLKYDE